MVRIRLQRMGKKKQPFYRIVAVDSRGRRDGKYLEKIGHYNPITDPFELVINEEKAIKWLKRGGLPSDTVKSFFRRKGILMRYDMLKKGFDTAKIEEEMVKWEVLQVERQRRLEAKKAQSKREKEPVTTETIAPAGETPMAEVAPQPVEEQ